MKRVVLVSIAGFVASLAGTARAEKEIGIGATYNPALPVSGLHSFVPDASPGGFQFKWDYFPVNALSIGFELQYNLFQRRSDTDTVEIQSGAITAANYRSASFLGFLPTVRYYVSTSAVRPYLEMGIGMASVATSVFVSDLSDSRTRAAFMLQPSVGVLLPLWSSSDAAEWKSRTEEYPDIRWRKPRESMFGLTASATYAFTTAEFRDASTLSYAGIQVGIYAKP